MCNRWNMDWKEWRQPCLVCITLPKVALLLVLDWTLMRALTRRLLMKSLVSPSCPSSLPPTRYDLIYDTIIRRGTYFLFHFVSLRLWLLTMPWSKWVEPSTLLPSPSWRWLTIFVFWDLVPDVVLANSFFQVTQFYLYYQLSNTVLLILFQKTSLDPPSCPERSIPPNARLSQWYIWFSFTRLGYVLMNVIGVRTSDWKQCCHLCWWIQRSLWA